MGLVSPWNNDIYVCLRTSSSISCTTSSLIPRSRYSRHFTHFVPVEYFDSIYKSEFPTTLWIERAVFFSSSFVPEVASSIIIIESFGGSIITLINRFRNPINPGKFAFIRNPPLHWNSSKSLVASPGKRKKKTRPLLFSREIYEDDDKTFGTLGK